MFRLVKPASIIPVHGEFRHLTANANLAEAYGIKKSLVIENGTMVKVSNKDIICLSDAYKEIFKTENLSENLNKLNGNFKENSLVNDVVEFINKDKKRPICTPFLKQ